MFNQEDSSNRQSVASPIISQPVTEKTDETTSVLGILTTLANEINKLNTALATPTSLQILQVEPTLQSATTAQPHLTTDLNSGRPPKRRRTDDADQNGGHIHVSQTPVSQRAGYCSSVVEDVLEELLMIYFTRVQPWIPLLQEASFRRRLRTNERSKLSVILHAMIVAALRFVKKDGQLLSMDVLEGEVRRAREFVILTCMNGLTVEHLQALAILAFTDVSMNLIKRS